MTALRVVRSGAAAPAWNMALDEALLAVDGPPTLRLYGWRPAGLSLGRFQRLATFTGVPGDHVLVRRCTGGGAIYHADEITFAITARSADLGSVEASYCTVHRAVARVLRRFGVPVEMCAGERPSPRPDQAWCFEVPGRFDLVAAGKKIAGSAQRRDRRTGRVLHHGSIVLRAPPATPFCAAVADHVAALDESALGDELVEEIAAALGMAPVAGGLTPRELAMARELHGARDAELARR